MLRCPTCGRRVAGRACAAHGDVGSVPTVEPIEPLLPGFRVVRVLGAGGFGTVVAVERDGGTAAVKVARADVPAADERLLHEIEALRAVGPPHVPAVLDAGVLADGRRFLTMELLDAPLLADLLATDERPDREHFPARAAAILRALAAVHARGLVHRDLKPENVFLVGDGAVLIDFGLVWRPGSARITQAGSVIGTAEYMAPEQCAAGEVDARTDVYAAGVLFFEMLAGRPPFFGAATDVRQAHIGRRPPRLSRLAAVAPAVEDVLERALAKEPGDRWESATAFAEALAGAWGAAPERSVEDARASARPREQRPVGLVFFHAVALAGVQGALAGFGGQLAYLAGDQCVGIFDGGDHPARRAWRFAGGLVAGGLAARAVVDLASVTVLPRPDGSRRYHSPLFARRDRYPAADEPPGVRVTPSAAQVLETPGDELPGQSDTTRLTLYGRDRELATLERALARALDERVPTLATVVGEPGHGKSHLAAALRARLRGGVARIVDLRAREPVGGEEDETLRALLGAVLTLPAQPPVDRGRALLAAALGDAFAQELWAGFALALGWVTPAEPEVKALAQAPGVLRAAAARAAGETLRVLARQRPLAVLLDDAQYADEAAAQALEHATAAGSELPLFACVLARPGFVDRRPGWGVRAGVHEVVRLEALDERAAADLCRHLLEPAENVPADAVERLVARTQGVPVQLVELVRSLKQQGLVRRHAEQASYYLATDELDALPDLPLLVWLAGRELSVLPEELAAHARLCAVLGFELRTEELVGVLGGLERTGDAAAFPLDAGVATRWLIDEGMLVTRGDGRVTFRHALVRDAIADSLPASLRTAIHVAAYRYHASAAEPDLPRLARHAARSGRAAEAATAFLTLGERAQARHAYVEAESMYSQALASLSAADPRRAMALKGRGTMRYRLGRYEDAFVDYDEARALVAAAGDVERQVELLLAEATALDWLVKWATSKARLDEAEALAKGLCSPLIEAELHMARGRSHWRFEELAEAVTCLERAVAIAEGLDGAYETLVASLLMLQWLLPRIGRPLDAERCFAQVRELCSASGDRLHLTAALNNRYFISAASLDVEGVVRDQLEAIRLGRELGGLSALKREYFGEYNIAECLYMSGDTDAALVHVRRAAELERRNYGDTAKPFAPLLLARVLVVQGAHAEARRTHESLVGQQARAAETGHSDSLLGAAELVLLAMVELATRGGTAEAWDALCARAESQPPEVNMEVLDVAARATDGPRAKALFEKALGLCASTPSFLERRLRAGLSQVAATPSA